MKKDLLLLHGALGSHRQFDEMTERLSASFNVLSPDLSGHGKKTNDSGFTIETMASALIDELREQGIENPGVFGYSMGGYVALYIASQREYPLGNIMTYGTRFDWSEAYAREQKKMLDPELMKAKVRGFTDYLSQLHGEEEWEKVTIQTADMMTTLGKSPLLNESTLNHISNPVWITRGSEDNMVSLKESVRASELIPRAQYIEIDNQPHPIEKVSKEALVELVLTGFAH